MNLTLDLFLLRKASRLWGIQTSYLDIQQQEIKAPAETLVDVLKGLTGQEIKSNQDLEHLIQLRHQKMDQCGIEPVFVKWESEPGFVHLKLNEKEASTPVQISIEGEEGFQFSTTHHPVTSGSRFQLPNQMPVGYHHLTLKTKARELKALIVHAPKQIPDIKEYEKSWGVFLPLYAVRSPSDWGLGSFRDLKDAGDLIRPFGGKWVSSLPLLAGNFDKPDCDPSPYNAVTRLFWNEIYLDIESLVKRSESSRAQALISSSDFQSRLQKLKSSELVDYHQVYQLKREVLSILSEEFFASGAQKSQSYQNFLKLFSDLDAYAKFRTSAQKHQDFHKYAQFQTHLALTDLRNSSTGLYMDYPVGVNDAGFDFHNDPSIFFHDVEVGAPPEPVFQLGQGWGFPSYHPDRLRESQYSYVRKSLANHLRYSRILRLDHVMGLHRVYVVPKNKKPKDGVYLRYKPQELFAIACLEAFRAKADLIGENLGTVPDAVNEILEKRNFKGMTVGQFLFEETPDKFAEKIPEKTLACMNTHDMPMFAAFLTGEDLDQVTELGILNPDYTEKFKKDRMQAKSNWLQSTKSKDDAAIFPAVLNKMSESRARYLILNPEDTWREKRAQNIPGTYREVPNWRRKFSIPLNEWMHHPEVKSSFSMLAKSRPGTYDPDREKA